MKISLNIPTDEEVPLSGFVLGDMTISGTSGTSSSSDEKCKQMMMVFISIPLLIFGVQQLLRSPSQKHYRFVGVESSFSIDFKYEGNTIYVESMGQLIDKLTPQETYDCIVNSVSDIIEEFSPLLCKTDGAYHDLHSALISFIEHCLPIFD